MTHIYTKVMKPSKAVPNKEDIECQNGDYYMNLGPFHIESFDILIKEVLSSYTILHMWLDHLKY